MSHLISIICPIYNKGVFLQETIDSVFNQSFNNWELILIDDGSTDNSKIIMKQNAFDQRVRCFYNSNVGPYKERLFGAINAKGDYLLFLDADDTLADNALEILNNESDGFDFVKYNICFFDKNGAKKEQHLNIKTIEDYKKLIFEEKVNNICSTMIKKTVFDESLEELSKMPSAFSAEDLLMQLPIIDKIQNILYVDKPLYLYRFVNNSLARKKINVNDIEEQINPWRVRYLVEYSEKWKMKDVLVSIYTRAFAIICSVFRRGSLYSSTFALINSIKSKNWILDYCGGKMAVAYLDKADLNKQQKNICKMLLKQNGIKCFLFVTYFKIYNLKTTITNKKNNN